MNILDVLQYEEGYRSKPYIDTEGYPTVGIGTKIGPKGAKLFNYQFEIPIEIAKIWLNNDVADVKFTLSKIDWYNNLDDDRKVVIESMAYQMGAKGLLKFKNMIKAIKAKNWREAEKQALDSLWARQTPVRAKRHASVLGGETLINSYSK